LECGLSSMKFLGDMGISPRTIALLREQGYDAIHLVEQNLERMPDPNILDKARQEERILLTVDLDFAQLLAMSGERLPTYVQLWAAQVLAVALPRPWEKHLTPPSSVRISPSKVEQDWFRIISQLGTPSAPQTRGYSSGRKLGQFQSLRPRLAVIKKRKSHASIPKIAV